MTFQVLTAHGNDAKAWDGYLDMLPYDLRDVHVTAAYGRAHEMQEASARLAVLSDNGRIVLQPFLLRTIGDRTDMTAAGYGGPFTSHALPGSEDGAELEAAMQGWRVENRVVSEFYLINPIFAAHQMVVAKGTGAEFKPEKDVVILHLGSDEEILKGMRATRRHALQKARGSVIGDVRPDWFAWFYGEAMDRKDAARRWRFRPEYFDSLGMLGDDMRIIGGRDVVQSSTEAAAVFLFGKSVAYYHLAATVADPPPGAADAVIMAGARIARDRGCDWLHLGGGITAAKEDSLLAYKRSFGGVTRVTYSVRRIHDAAVYAELCGIGSGGGGLGDRLIKVMPGSPGTDFFPAYRAKEAA